MMVVVCSGLTSQVKNKKQNKQTNKQKLNGNKCTKERKCRASLRQGDSWETTFIKEH